MTAGREHEQGSLLQFVHCSPPSRYRREWRGIFVLGGESVTSVSVFIDYENTRFGAHEVFGDP